MKKFIFTILFLSIFFIGLGSIIEKAEAKFGSDERALELVRLARIAIGGEENIKTVRAMTISGTTTDYFQINSETSVKQGSLEINFALPDRFSKKIKIGETENITGGEPQKEFEVFIAEEKGDKIHWTSQDSSKDQPEGKKHRVVIRRDDQGKVLTENISEVEEFVFTKKADDGTSVDAPGENKKVFLHRADSGTHQNEMLRLTMALLLTPGTNAGVSYKFLGEGNVDGYQTNIIEILSGGSSFKLHLDAATNLPKMIGFSGMPRVARFFAKDRAKDSADKKVLIEKLASNEKTAEHQIRFADFRQAGNLLLPYSWSETVGGRQTQTLVVTNYEINPANIGEKFKDRNVFFKKAKPSNEN